MFTIIAIIATNLFITEMDKEKCEDKILLPHHEQLELCTTRLPYRQGRKLTAVKVYTVNDESNHLLIFGVPSLDLRQELKSHFTRFGKLIKFGISANHYSESFTHTYHAVYNNIQSARLAKKFLDTKNFYGGSLHVCYAPEFETIEETREKLDQRKKGVLSRLRNLDREKNDHNIEAKETTLDLNTASVSHTNVINRNTKLNMGEINTISIGKQIRDVFKKPAKRKNKNYSVVIEKKFKATDNKIEDKEKSMEMHQSTSPCDVIDCTSAEIKTVTDIDLEKVLNYSSFGNEVIKKVPQKPVNKIIFNINNKTL